MPYVIRSNKVRQWDGLLKSLTDEARCKDDWSRNRARKLKEQLGLDGAKDSQPVRLRSPGASVDIYRTKKRYRIIYADPAWHFNVWNTYKPRSASVHYDTMQLDEIKALPIPRIADDNCALFMWATCSNLPEALEVIQVWGFRYITVAFNWIKQKKGCGLLSAEVLADSDFRMSMGHYTRMASELCLLGLKGRMPRRSRDVQQVIAEPIRTHSQKPDQTRERIVRLFGDVPRIELFARQTPEGWDVFGNETNRFYGDT